MIGMDGDFNCALWPGEPALLNQRVCKVEVEERVYSRRFLAYALPAYLKLNNDHTSAITVKHLSSGTVQDIPLPLPPLREQERLARRLDELFSEIDDGERALKRVQKLVERYRQSVVKAAVIGGLTSGWRAERKTEPVANPDSLGEIAGLDEVPALPRGWQWTTLGVLLDDIQAGKSFKCDERPPLAGEYGLVKFSAVTWGRYDENESKTITDADRIDLRYLIREGDFLFSRANTVELVGACVLVHGTDWQLLLSDKILRFRFRVDVRTWVDLVLKSRLVRAQIEALATGNQESMRNIGQEQIRMIVIPMPPNDERKAIQDLVARRFQVMDATLEQARHERRMSVALRQAVLNAAFSGQLVPQDPADESAAALLARRAAQAGDAPPAPKRRGRKVSA